jgi:hypothetical protein
MELSQRKEQFSNAYLQAVSSVSGFSASKPTVDDDSIDWWIAARGGNGTTKSPRLELQLKCTAAPTPDDGFVSYALKLKNYDDLRAENVLVPRVLVVVLVPGDIESWLEQSEERLSMKRCGYWLSLRGMEEMENTSSVTVRLPRSNLFTVDALGSIMRDIGNGVWP